MRSSRPPRSEPFATADAAEAAATSSAGAVAREVAAALGLADLPAAAAVFEGGFPLLNVKT